MNYMANTGLLLLWLPTVFGRKFTVDWIVNELYDSTLGSDKPYEITVGVQTTINDWTLENEGTFFINLNKINNQSRILPNHNIRPIIKDDLEDEQRAFFVALEGWSDPSCSGAQTQNTEEGPVDFLFGGGYSTTTKSSAFVTQIYKTPQMSCLATSSDLSDYGTFSRTIGCDAAQSCAWAAIAYNFNWTNIGVISSKTNYGLGLAQGLSNCVKNFNISIKEEITFEKGVTDHKAKLDTIAKSEVFVYFIAMHNPDLQSLSRSLVDMNLIGPPYVYVASEAAGEDSTLFNETLPGLIWTSPYQPILNETSELISLQEHYEAENLTESDSPLGVYGPYCWDVALVLADFFDNYTKRYPNSSTVGAGGNWSSFLQSYEKSGATGTLKFDKNLDRDLTKWAIYNCNGTKCNIVGVTWSTKVLLYYPRNETAEIYWHTGAKGISNTPPDGPLHIKKWIYIRSDARVFYGFFCGTTIIMSICLIFLSYRWRNDNSVRMTSWKLNIVIIFGIDIVTLCFSFDVMDEEDWGQDSLESFCFARTFLFLTGFSIFIGTIFSKIYRVHKIFNTRRYSEQKKPVEDHQIMKVVLMYTTFNLTVITVSQLLFPWKREINYVHETQINIWTHQQTLYGYCTMEKADILQMILLVANGGVIILGAKWAWETRGVKYAALNDSVQVGYILMLIILLYSFNLICTSLIDNPNFNFFVSFISMLLVTWFTIGVLFLLKYWHMFCRDEEEEEEEDRSPYDSGKAYGNRCSHCNMHLPQTNYALSCSREVTRETASENTAELQLAKPVFAVRSPQKVKSIENMSIDEILDVVDESLNSALEEDNKIDNPLVKASGQKK